MRNKIIAAIIVAVLGGLAIVFRPTVVEIGQKAPDARLTSLAGQSLSLSDYRGKVVLLSFWATWCQSCEEELPQLDGLYRKYRDRGLEVIAPSVDSDGRKAVMPFMANRSWSFTVGLADPLAAEAFGVRGLPCVYLIGVDGIVLHRYIGEVQPQLLENDILAALERRPS